MHQKIEIIRTKLNFLFGFVNQTTTTSTFNQLKTELIDEVKKISKIILNNILVLLEIYQIKRILNN